MATATAKRKTKPNASVPVEDQRKLYQYLIKSRTFDERCRRLFKQGRFPGTYFSAVGQEASSVGSAYDLTQQDLDNLSDFILALDFDRHAKKVLTRKDIDAENSFKQGD